MLLYPVAAVIIGFVGLIWSADKFVSGAAATARYMGMSTILIGLTIVAFGTSAPEIIVSISAALSGAGELAIGNALGSNIANVGLVLGATVLIAPMPAAASLLKKEIPVLLFVTVVAGICLYDLTLTVFDGLTLIAILVIIFIYLLKNRSATPLTDLDDSADTPAEMTMAKAWAWLLIGLILLLVSANLLVWGAKAIAVYAGVSQLVIGLTIVAVGTSLPELAASIVSALKGHHDIALGNIIGSNILNILAVMSMPGIISSITLDTTVFSRDYFAMLLLTLFIAAMVLLVTQRQSIGRQRTGQQSTGSAKLGRITGIALLTMYGTYYFVLFSTGDIA